MRYPWILFGSLQSLHLHAMRSPFFLEILLSDNIFQMFALYEHQVAVLDRKSFGQIGADGRYFLRLSIAADQAVLEEGIRRLKAASEDLSGLDKFMKERPDLIPD